MTVENIRPIHLDKWDLNLFQARIERSQEELKDLGRP
jgi:hypothetical protein